MTRCHVYFEYKN